MRTVKIDVTKLDKTAFFKGAKGTYADIVLWDKPDDYGNEGFVTQDIGKERRTKGERGPILGNAKFVGTVQPSRPTPAPEPAKFTPGGGHTGGEDMADVPFAPFKF